MTNSSTDPHDVEPDAMAEAEAGDAASDVGRTGSLFPGDTGALALDTRRVLVQLLLGPALDATRQRRLWPVLLRDEALVRSRLHELFLDLVLDRELQVAYTRQVAADDLDAPVLLRKAHLTFLETALVLELRRRLMQAEAQGERAVVAADELRAHLAVFEREANADQARWERQVQAAVEKAKKLNLLRLLPGGQQRFEVSPALKLLFPAEAIQALALTYAAARAGGAGALDLDPAAADDDLAEPDR